MSGTRSAAGSSASHVANERHHSSPLPGSRSLLPFRDASWTAASRFPSATSAHTILLSCQTTTVRPSLFRTRGLQAVRARRTSAPAAAGIRPSVHLADDDAAVRGAIDEDRRPAPGDFPLGAADQAELHHGEVEDPRVEAEPAVCEVALQIRRCPR